MPQAEPRFLTEPHILADHPVLDLLNTVAVVNGEIHDFFQTDTDVLRWLVKTDGASCPSPVFKDGELVRCARSLRETIRELVILRKKGQTGDPQALNRFLAETPSFLQLTWSAPEQLSANKVALQQNPQTLLASLAEAAVELLTHGDFTLVRKCEHPECVLWFYDRTKSHRRRWCSMSLCGNRHKVAEFRKRQQQ